jgi:hypothetical protein
MHPDTNAVNSLLAHLVANGFTIHSVDDGGDTYLNPTIEEAAGHILGVDESHLIVTHPSVPSRKNPNTLARMSLFIVLGNSPWELVCDHSNTEPLTSCVDAWSTACEQACNK